MKCSIFLFFFQLMACCASGQFNNKLSIELMPGANYHLPRYTPRANEQTLVSPVKNGGHFGRNHGVNVSYALSDKIDVGFGIGVIQFSWGWNAAHKLNQGGVGISSFGRFFSNDLIHFDAFINHNIIRGKHFRVYNNFRIVALNYKSTKDLVDTTEINAFWRSPASKNEIMYIASPAKEKEGFHILVAYNIGLQYTIGRFLYFDTKLGFQYGTSTILEQDVTIIRQYEQKEYTYHSKVKGTAGLFQLGIGVKL